MQKIARISGNRAYCGANVFKFFAAASALLTLFALLSPCHLRAQLATADVLGTVTDATGAVVPDAKVTIINTGTGISSTQKSSKTGEFLFSHVQIGTFKVTVEAKGFKIYVATGLTVGVGDRTRVDAKLEVGSQVETVEVAASVAAALQTDSSNISSLISTNAVADMPLNGRNIYDLIALQAGSTESSGGGDPTDARPVQAFSANGQNSEYNNNMIDGMDNNERSLGEVAVEPSLDALQEVKVETSNYSAEYSRTGGGIANLITKSGTNKFSGTLFEFMRNDDFDAFNRFATSKAELRQNQFGGSLGGPILKNKAFFFGDYQGWRLVKGGTGTDLVPTQAEYDQIHASGVTTSGVTFEDSQGATVTVPASAISTPGLTYLQMLPAPNYSGSSAYNFVTNLNTVQNANTYDGRIDYHFSDKNTLFGRYSYNKTNTTTPGGIPNATVDSKPYYQGTTINSVVEQNLALDYVHVYSPRVLGEVKVSYLRSNMAAGSEDTGLWSSTDIGMPCNADYCYNVSGVYGIPVLGFSGVSYPGTGDNGNLGYIENTFQYNGSLTWNRNTHSIKMGATLIRRQADAPTASNSGMTVSGSYTGNALADLLEGLAVVGQGRVTMIVPRFRMWEPSAYIQDDWRARTWLTLNLGVRYDIYTPWTERYGHLSNFNDSTDLIVSPDLLGDNAASPTANVKTDFGDVAPRIGFAATLGHNMVLRGGWGLSYFPANTNGRGQWEMLNAPFIWSFGCGIEPYSSSPCPAGNGLYGYSNSSLNGGFNMNVGDPRAYYETALATDPSNYAGLGSNNNYITPNFKPSYLEQFNLQLQKQFGQNIVTAGFVGSLGRRLPTQQNLNQPISPTAPYPMASSSTVLADGTNWMDGAIIPMALSAVNSTWTAGEFTYERRLSAGLSANVNYTWSHTEGDSTGASECVFDGCPMDNGNGGTTLINGWQQYNWTGSSQQRLAGIVSYSLPFGRSLRGVAGEVVKGWSLNGTGWWQTGAYTTATNGNSRFGVSGRMETDYPDMIASPKLKRPTLDEWFNIAAFKAQTEGTLGNERQNTIVGPRQRDADLSLSKTFDLVEKFKLQFRAEAFNFTNTPSFAFASGFGGGATSISAYDSNGIATSQGGFGAITSAGDPRVFQFGLKLLY